MKNINNFIQEKLRIDKDTKIYAPDDKEFYDNCDIPEIDNDIDDKLEKKKTNNWFPFKKRKSNGKNTNWYRFYCYLYFNGPAKKTDVVKAIKGDTNSQYAETFTELRRFNICSSEKGLWKAENPKNWNI